MERKDRIALLERAYRLFNDRHVDALLAMMTDDVEWPDVANRAVLSGKQAIRPYWAAQFAVADPQVRPTAFIDAGDDLVAVVDQRILDREGRPLAPPAVVFHRYTFDGGLVRRMVVFTDADEAVIAG
jgi:hypothetical protein